VGVGDGMGTATHKCFSSGVLLCILHTDILEYMTTLDGDGNTNSSRSRTRKEGLGRGGRRNVGRND